MIDDAPPVEEEPAGHGAMPVVATAVGLPTGLAVPTAPPPAQYEPASQPAGASSASAAMKKPGDTMHEKMPA